MTILVQRHYFVEQCLLCSMTEIDQVMNIALVDTVELRQN